ncbi:dopamine receptor 2-like [Centruroides vittatus]|uniref:dopamine receptor 2-like n=1 Tax=Centruroides vittatus TaxID=120091 RepID=UPI003510D068
MSDSLEPDYLNQVNMTAWLLATMRSQGVSINNSSWSADNIDDSSSILIASNVTTKPELHIHRPLLAVLLAFFCVVTVFGNVLVMVAVAREQYLHTVTNYFIASLATADCLVGALVMPFSAVHEVMEKVWIFGQDWCDTWHSLDVLASTASILNLCVISLDRYWAITDPITYPSRMTPMKAGILIALVWMCSALISFPAIAWWRAMSKEDPPPYECLFTDDVGYLVFSSTISFYGPLTVMVFTYFKIYRAAVEQTRSLKVGCKQVQAMNGNHKTPLTLRMHRGGMFQSGSYRSIYSTVSNGHDNGYERGTSFKFTNKNLKSFSLSRKLSKLAKERKAAKTLGIVMGVFILCWLPFFVTNVLIGICGEKCIVKPDLVLSIVTWLGWLNSGMNPVIYACWSRDFRRAFTKFLCFCFPRYIRKKRSYRTRLRRTLKEDIGMASMKSSATEEVHL